MRGGHDRYCFCTDCCESKEHEGEDYDEWRLAFPALPWNDEVPMKEMTKARREFLTETSKAGGRISVDFYPPVKWAMAKGYVTLKTGQFGSTTYFITEAGHEALKEP